MNDFLYPILFYTFIDEVKEKGLLNVYRNIISPREVDRLNTFKLINKQEEYLVTRAFIRFIVSRITKIPPTFLKFKSNAYGKPELISKQNKINLEFNLSHSGNLVACCIARGRSVGIDVEGLTRQINFEVAEYCFSDSEQEWFDTQPLELKKQKFFDIWTIKEAYIKAIGRGLSMPLKNFSVIPHPFSPTISFSDSLNDHPQNWKIFSFDLYPGYRAAVVIQCKNEETIFFKVRSCIPFISSISL